MTATDELRRLLDERGVEWKAFDDFEQTMQWSTHNGAFVYWARERDGKLLVETTAPTKCSASCTPEQAIAATLGNEGVGRSNDGVAELEAGTCRRVYLVEVSDDLIESWHPLAVYLHREAAEDCAEALRKEEDGVLQFARVSELKVVDDG